MKADIIPMEIAMVFLAEILYGIGYNALVSILLKHRLMHVSVSVVIGVFVTLLIPSLFWFDHRMPFWESGLLLLVCFSASGTPMVIGSMRRTVVQKDDKKRRRIGNAAARVRDEVVMDLAAMAHEIAEKAKQESIRVHDLPDYVNRLHGLIGALKSL